MASTGVPGTAVVASGCVGATVVVPPHPDTAAAVPRSPRAADEPSSPRSAAAVGEPSSPSSPSSSQEPASPSAADQLSWNNGTGAMPSVAPGKTIRTWRPVAHHTAVVVTGGYLPVGSPEVVTAIDIQVAPGQVPRSFVELQKKFKWIQRASAGTAATSMSRNGVLKRSRIIEQLRTAALEQLDPVTAAAEAAASPTDTDDPMNQFAVEEAIEDLDPANSTRSGKRKRIPKSKVAGGVAIAEVSVRCPLAYTGENSTFSLPVYYTPPSGSGPGKIFIPVEYIEWLLAYIADELLCGGVAAPVDSGAVIADEEPNCEEVPGLHISFNWRTRMFDARFVTPHALGSQTFRHAPDSMTAAKWDDLLKWPELNCRISGEWTHATPTAVHLAAQLHLLRHCAAMLRRHDADAFP